MEDQKIESQETQSETPKKELAPVKFYREHKKTIKDVLIGVAAGVGLAFLIKASMGSSDNDECYDTEGWDESEDTSDSMSDED